MLQAARELEFEKAARIRDRIKQLRQQLLIEF
jgi:excinuclease UvrABC helicase subunit UvrB